MACVGEANGPGLLRREGKLVQTPCGRQTAATGILEDFTHLSHTGAPTAPELGSFHSDRPPSNERLTARNPILENVGMAYRVVIERLEFQGRCGVMPEIGRAHV